MLAPRKPRMSCCARTESAVVPADTKACAGTGPLNTAETCRSICSQPRGPGAAHASVPVSAGTVTLCWPSDVPLRIMSSVMICQSSVGYPPDDIGFACMPEALRCQPTPCGKTILKAKLSMQRVALLCQQSLKAVLVPHPHRSERSARVPSVQAQSPGTPLRQRPHRCPDSSHAPFHSAAGIHFGLHSGERMPPSLAARHADWRTSVSAREAPEDCYQSLLRLHGFWLHFCRHSCID